MPDEEIAAVARKHAIRNALEYGQAQPGPVLNKVFSEIPSAKEDVKHVVEIIGKVVREVNSMAKAQVEEEFSRYEFPEKAERHGLPELPWVVPGTKVNTRFAPNPSGFLHIGHSKVMILSDEYSKKYCGSFYVRFEDTDPKGKKPIPEAYNMTIKDIEWLGCSIAAVIKQSERMSLYYAFAERLIREGKAYVCTCAKEVLQENRRKGIACQCRGRSSIDDWKKMHDGGFSEASAVLRLKTDMKHPNPSVRDWVLFRIIDEAHPLTGTRYRVWPLYNFAAVIDDHEMGINLVIRGKEHEINAVKQGMLFGAFSWEMPHIIEVGTLKVHGELAHKSDIRNAIKAGTLSGWDDPRAPTIMAFRKKGIDPRAIRTYIISSGIGKSDSYLDIKKLESFDRKIKKDPNDA